MLTFAHITVPFIAIDDITPKIQCEIEKYLWKIFYSLSKTQVCLHVFRIFYVKSSETGIEGNQICDISINQDHVS